MEHNQEIINQIESINQRIDGVNRVMGSVLHLLGKLNEAMEEGFAKVNERLASLEGKEGMQGVNKQLGDIKSELQKIQKVYPYDDMHDNMKSIQGQA